MSDEQNKLALRPDAITINDMLREYLHEQQQNSADGFTLPNLFLRFNEMERKQREDRATLVQHGLRLDRHGQDIRGIKRALREQNIYDDGLGDVDTGQFRVEELLRAAAEQKARNEAEDRARKDSVIWWKRSLISWIVAGFGALVLAVLSGCGAYFLTTLQKGPKEK